MVAWIRILLYLARLFLGLVYPAWETVRAIESRATADDTQWLTYWLAFAIVEVVEETVWPILQWVKPVWDLTKLLLTAWLVLPQFKGSTWVYESLVRPALHTLRVEIKKFPALENAVRKLEGKPAPPLRESVGLGGQEYVDAADETSKKLT